jgi:arginine-tRNA-protein transferase
MERQPVVLEDTVVPCSYLPNREFRSENFLFPAVTPQQLDRFLERGYRHFGYYFFRPFCKTCRQCIPLRVPVADFVPGTSLKRIRARNRDLSVVLERPNPSEEAFSLYKKHKMKFGDTAFESYGTFISSFYHPFAFSYQLTMRKDETLLGVAHLDITESSISSIYCYYDTDYRKESLGTYAIMKSLEIARSRELSHLYLGYYIKDCSHMSYKGRFRPNQALMTDGKWEDFVPLSSTSVPLGMVKQGFRPKKRLESWFDGYMTGGV